jgi:hypothetical protein
MGTKKIIIRSLVSDRNHTKTQSRSPKSVESKKITHDILLAQLDQLPIISVVRKITKNTLLLISREKRSNQSMEKSVRCISAIKI